VVDDCVQIAEAAIVIKAALQVSGERANGRGAITHIRAALSLETVNANIGCGVQISSGFSPQRLDVAVIASGFSAEEFVATSGRRFVERHRRIRRR